MYLTQEILDDLTYEITNCAIDVHRHLGPGLLESVYHKCIAKEFDLRKIKYTSECPVHVQYKGFRLDTRLRCDFLVENAIVLELKAVEKVNPITDAQLLTYMNLLKTPKGIRINFHVKNIFKEGQKTMVNDLFKALPKC